MQIIILKKKKLISIIQYKIKQVVWFLTLEHRLVVIFKGYNMFIKVSVMSQLYSIKRKIIKYLDCVLKSCIIVVLYPSQNFNIKYVEFPFVLTSVFKFVYTLWYACIYDRNNEI